MLGPGHPPVRQTEAIVDEGAVIREVDPARAEAVLCIRLFVPGVTEGGEDLHYLTRTPPRLNRVVESVTRNPDGSVTTVRTCTSQESLVAHCTHADGRTPDGRGCGYAKTVAIVGRAADEAAVHVSMYWTASDGSRGHLDEELVVPWLGAARAELGGGGWVATEITPARAILR
jgi:hypothetical protein